MTQNTVTEPRAVIPMIEKNNLLVLIPDLSASFKPLHLMRHRIAGKASVEPLVK